MLDKTKQIDHCKDCYFYRDGVCKNELSYNCGKEPTRECYLWGPYICDGKDD